MQFFFSKTPIIRYIDKHSIFKSNLAIFRITCLKVAWLFVLQHHTIFSQIEMKRLVMLSLPLSLSVSLCFNHYTVLLYLQLPFHPNSSKIYWSIGFITISFELSTFCLVVSLINGSNTLLLIISINLWGKYLPFIKLFTVNNNYLRLIKPFTVNNICLPLIQIFTVNPTLYRS